MRLDEMERWLVEHDFSLVNTRGSHRIYRHKETHYRVTVATHDGELRPYQVRHILRSIQQMRGGETER